MRLAFTSLSQASKLSLSLPSKARIEREWELVRGKKGALVVVFIQRVYRAFLGQKSGSSSSSSKQQRRQRLKKDRGVYYCCQLFCKAAITSLASSTHCATFSRDDNWTWSERGGGDIQKHGLSEKFSFVQLVQLKTFSPVKKGKLLFNRTHTFEAHPYEHI